MDALLADRIALQIGFVTIYWYGLFVAAGFLTALVVMQWRSGKVGIPGAAVSDLTFAAMVGGIVGARCLYVLLNLNDYLRDPVEIIRIDHGGLVFYGGFFGATVAVMYVVRRYRLEVRSVADLFAVGVPLGHAVGRLGCFFNGCCFGRTGGGVFATTYPRESGVWYTQIGQGDVTETASACLPVHPTQLYEALLNVAIAFILLRRHRAVPGQVFALYLMMYGGGRFVIEAFRGDYLHRHAGLSVSQIICLVIFPIGVALYRYCGRPSVSPSRLSSPSH